MTHDAGFPSRRPAMHGSRFILRSGKVFSLLTDDVKWANGMSKTHVHVKEAIRESWTHQWSLIDP